MRVVAELFDVKDSEWFTPKLAPSTSRTSSGAAPNCCDLFLESGLEQPPLPTHADPLPRGMPPDVDCELELLTPEFDSPQMTEFRFVADDAVPVDGADLFETGFEIGDDCAAQTRACVHGPTEPMVRYTNLCESEVEVDGADLATTLWEEPGQVEVGMKSKVEDAVGKDVGHGAGMSAHSGNGNVDKSQVEHSEVMLSYVEEMKDLEDCEDMRAQISIEEMYKTLGMNGHSLPDVNAYLGTMYGGCGSDSGPGSKNGGKKGRRVSCSKKRKLSKREQAKAASAAELAKEEELARLAKNQQITDDELLRLRPKKQRRAAKFDKPVPSRFCHVCSRTPKNVRLVVCSKIKEGTCRKVICEKCFEEYKYGDFDLALHTDASEWICPHCSHTCPERAQCRTYQRINDRLRVSRLKQEKPRTPGSRAKRTRRALDAESGMGSFAEGAGDKRPRFLLPAVVPGMGVDGFDVGHALGIGLDGIEVDGLSAVDGAGVLPGCLGEVLEE